MRLSLFYPVRRGSWRRSILLIVKERERKREGKKRRETRHACAFSPIHREGIESGEGKRKETMLEGDGKRCWKDAAWNARAEDGEIVSFRQTYLLLLFYEPIDHSFPYLRTVVSPPSLYDIVSLTVTQAQQALDFHFCTDSRIILSFKSSISGGRIYLEVLAPESWIEILIIMGIMYRVSLISYILNVAIIIL